MSCHPNSPVCYRITEIPPSWDVKHVWTVLHEFDPLAFVSSELKSNISLFPSLYGQTLTAIATASMRSACLESKNHFHIVNPAVPESTEDVYLTIDSSFLGLTPLNDPGSGDIDADIVAVCHDFPVH